MTSKQDPDGGRRGDGGCGGAGRHGMLLFGHDPMYLSLLTTCACSPGYQVLLEARLDGPALDAGDSYTLDPDPFPITDLEPRDGVPPLTSLTGTLVRGGTPIAAGVRVDIQSVVWFHPVDAEATPGPRQALEYLCFGRGDQVYLVHPIPAWPSFQQVLAVRLVPGTVRTLVGHPLDDDVAAIRFTQAQRTEVSRDDVAERRLVAGEVATLAFPLSRSPSFSRGFTVQVEVEHEEYLEIDDSVSPTQREGESNVDHP
jgi:hypothetical protein